MALTNSIQKITAPGNGVSQVFSFSPMALINDTSELQVTHVDANGVETVLIEENTTTGYSVTLTGDFPSSGSITYPAVLGTLLPSGEKLIIQRIMVIDQQTVLNNVTTYFPKTLERSLDKQAAIAMQLQEVLDRTMRFPTGDPLNATAQLPALAARASKLAGWDGSGAWTTYNPNDGSSTSVTATNSTASRSLAERFGMVFDVRDYGAVGDGVTDDSAAFQAAHDSAVTNAPLGATLYMPRGRYLLASAIVLTHNLLAVVGESRSAVEVLQGADGQRLWQQLDGTERLGITLRDFRMTGRWNSNQTLGGDADRHCTLLNYRNIELINLSSIFCRQMALTGLAKDSLLIHNCRIWYCARDAINFSGTKGLTRILENEIRHCADDAIALHTTSVEGNPPREGIIISGNHIEDAFGIKVLGAKHASITHNVIRRAIAYGIRVGLDGTTEGLNDQLGLDISHNIIMDVFDGTLVGSGATQAHIYVDSVEPSTGGGATAVPPGQFDHTGNVWIKENDWWLDTIGLSASVPKSGSWFGSVQGNICAQTLDDVAAYSDWGFGAPEAAGRLFKATGWIDPTISNHIRSGRGVQVAGTIDQLTVDGNLFYGLAYGSQYAGGATRVHRHTYQNNSFVRIGLYAVGGDELAKNEDMRVLLLRNSIDMDPLLEHADRNADGSWANATTSGNAFDIVNWTGIIIEGNHLKNAKGMFHSNGSSVYSMKDNWIYGEFVGLSSASNKGVRDTEESGAQFYVFIDSDPASANYDRTIKYPDFSAPSIPTNGSYFQGHIVRSNAPTASVYGWLRLTTGSGHVLNTDWAELNIPAVAAQAAMEAGSDTTIANVVTPGRQKFHPLHPKVWARITWASGVPSLVADEGVSSVSGSAGSATVNFDSAFSSANYCVTGSLSSSSGGASSIEPQMDGANSTTSALHLDTVDKAAGTIVSANGVHTHTMITGDL